MTDRPTILLSNDDGYNARGLRYFYEALTTWANVIVFAPETNHSGASNSLTVARPLRVTKAVNGFYFVNGTPTDCVHVALTGMLSIKPDLVVSGINNGANLGSDTLYSGTVAAASEGYLFGYPAMAFSLTAKQWLHLEAAVDIANQLVRRAIDNLPAKPLLLNVNIPPLPAHDISQVRLTRLGKRHPSQNVIPTQAPSGETLYWIGPQGDYAEEAPDTDFAAIEQGCVSITPLQLDFSHTAAAPAVQRWLQLSEKM